MQPTGHAYGALLPEQNHVEEAGQVYAADLGLDPTLPGRANTLAMCGACTVHQNGKAVRSCITTMQRAAGSEIRTIEDVAAHGLHPVQKAWMEVSVPQCGYCQSGQIMQAISLLNEKQKPTDQDIDDGMSGNICRCGTYQRIRAAIKAAAGERA